MGPALLALLWLGAPTPAAADLVVAPGSVEDCMVWSLVDMERAPTAERRRWALRASYAVVRQAVDVVERGGSPDQALDRQRELQLLVRIRLASAEAAPAACLERFPLPSPEEVADTLGDDTKTPAGEGGRLEKPKD